MPPFECHGKNNSNIRVYATLCKMVQSANTQLPVYRILGTIIEHTSLHNNEFDCVRKCCGMKNV